MHASATLDGFDLKLLRALERDGRLTNQALAEEIGLSASQCSRRRASLEAQGIIRGYRAILDAPALGYDLLAFIQVTLATHSGDNAARFRALMQSLDAVQECYAMTGDADYLIKAILPGLDALATLVNDALLPHPSVAHVRSSIVFERIKDRPSLPLPVRPPAPKR